MMSSRLRLFAALLLPAALSLPSAVAADTAAHPPGKFGWVDLVTTDPEAAIKFYTEIFGWTAQDVPGTRERYTLLLNHGQAVAGVAYRRADDANSGRSGARWVGSISVPDIQAATAAVAAAGGRVLVAPRQIAHRGWQAVVTDPEGAVFGLIVREKQSETGPSRTQNSWAWVQLFARNPVEAGAFYANALGYEIAADTRTVRPDDYLLSHDGVVCAGLTPLPEKGGGRPGWLGYIRVADVAATVKAAEARGGHLLLPVQDVPGALQVAIVTDPLGGAIGLVGRITSASVEASR